MLFVYVMNINFEKHLKRQKVNFKPKNKDLPFSYIFAEVTQYYFSKLFSAKKTPEVQNNTKELHRKECFF